MNVQTEFAPPPSPTLFKGEVIVGPPRPRIYVDQLVASSIKNPIVLHSVASQLKDNKAGNDILLPKENPLVRYVAERMETEIAQFGSRSQILQEAITNGAEAKRSDGKKVRVEVSLKENEASIADNGKGMRLVEEFFTQVLKPHSGEEGKVRGQFGQGTKAYWGLLNRPESFIEIESTTEMEPRQSFRVKMFYDENHRRCLEFLPSTSDIIGSKVTFRNCDLGASAQLLESIQNNVQDIDYAAIYCNGRILNAAASESQTYCDARGTGIKLIGDMSEMKPLVKTRINVRGEKMRESSYESDRNEGEKIGESRLVIDLSKESMKAEARSNEHLILTSADRDMLITQISIIARDDQLEPAKKVHILAALSRPLAFLQKNSNQSKEPQDDLIRHLAAHLIPLTTSLELSVVEADTGIEAMDWGKDVIPIDEALIGYFPVEQRSICQQIARGYSGGKLQLLEGPIKKGSNGEMGEPIMRVGNKLYINQELLMGEDLEFPMRASACNTLIKLWNDVGLDNVPIDGVFTDSQFGPVTRRLDEAQELWPNMSFTPLSIEALLKASGERLNQPEKGNPQIDNLNLLSKPRKGGEMSELEAIAAGEEILITGAEEELMAIHTGRLPWKSEEEMKNLERQAHVEHYQRERLSIENAHTLILKNFPSLEEIHEGVVDLKVDYIKRCFHQIRTNNYTEDNQIFKLFFGDVDLQRERIHYKDIKERAIDTQDNGPELHLNKVWDPIFEKIVKTHGKDAEIFAQYLKGNKNRLFDFISTTSAGYELSFYVSNQEDDLESLRLLTPDQKNERIKWVLDTIQQLDPLSKNLFIEANFDSAFYTYLNPEVGKEEEVDFLSVYDPIKEGLVKSIASEVGSLYELSSNNQLFQLQHIIQGKPVDIPALKRQLAQNISSTLFYSHKGFDIAYQQWLRENQEDFSHMLDEYSNVIDLRRCLGSSGQTPFKYIFERGYVGEDIKKTSHFIEELQLNKRYANPTDEYRFNALLRIAHDKNFNEIHISQLPIVYELCEEKLKSLTNETLIQFAHGNYNLGRNGNGDFIVDPDYKERIITNLLPYTRLSSEIWNAYVSDVLQRMSQGEDPANQKWS